MIDKIQDYEDRVKIAEKMSAQTYPISESRYKADNLTPFRLYDCLVPNLKDHIPFADVIRPTPVNYMADLGVQV